tara:strand:- start:58 stop:681 length:624 start_codon:yes stop_codon:yes gene_type:complete
MFKYNYKVGRAIPIRECQIILKDLYEQSDKFNVTTEFGDISLSVYESDYDDIDDCDGKKIMDYRIKLLEKELGLKFDRDKFIIRYTDDLLEMIPHYDGSFTTTLIYLNNNFKGGSTEFPLANLEHKPQKYKPGHYIHYNSNHILSYHGGTPVTEGAKTVIVLRSMKMTLWKVLTILPWRLFRDVFFKIVVLDLILKNIFKRVNGKKL